MVGLSASRMWIPPATRPRPSRARPAAASICARYLLHRTAGFLPRLEPALHVHHVCETHCLRGGGSQRGTASAGAIEHQAFSGGEYRIVERAGRVDAEFEHASVHVHGSGDGALAGHLGAVAQVDERHVLVSDPGHRLTRRNRIDGGVRLFQNLPQCLHWMFATSFASSAVRGAIWSTRMLSRAACAPSPAAPRPSSVGTPIAAVKL